MPQDSENGFSQYSNRVPLELKSNVPTRSGRSVNTLEICICCGKFSLSKGGGGSRTDLNAIFVAWRIKLPFLLSITVFYTSVALQLSMKVLRYAGT
jgi:hypothetical protein